MADMSFKQKIFKTLYGMGLKNFGSELLSDMKKGSPAWVEFAQSLLESNDYPTRKIALKQLMSKSMLGRHRSKDQLLTLLLEFLSNTHSIADEKKAVLKFIDKNLDILPKEEDFFRGRVLALQRETDVEISSLVEALMPKMGINMDDRSLYRR